MTTDRKSRLFNDAAKTSVWAAFVDFHLNTIKVDTTRAVTPKASAPAPTAAKL